MANIKVDFDKTIGKIKPMHGVGQPPFVGIDFSMFSYLKDAGIPYSRLHDVGGAYGENRWVDVPNIFRNFDADPESPESYDFAFTDLMITALIENGVEPFFRLGVTIENQAKIKAYRIYPPKDYHKWAKICEMIIRHYTEGWANGFKYNINYWEIWNEPDNFEEIEENQMWKGTKEQFYELYGVASKHLKNCFPHLKIGGYASCGFYMLSSSYVPTAISSPRYDYFVRFFDGFLDYIQKNDCPLDFFSWHSYDRIENNVVYASYAKQRLTEAGYPHTETTCNEWNSNVNARGTYNHAARTMGMMCAFQNTPLDSAMFYDARVGIGVYGALFNPMTKKPYPTYYAFKSYNSLYVCQNQVQIENDETGIYALAAKKDTKGMIVVSNPSDQDVPLCLKMQGKIKRCTVMADGHHLEEIDLPDILSKESFLEIEVEL